MYIGIDPGKEGGIAVFDPKEDKIVRLIPMPFFKVKVKGKSRTTIDTLALKEILTEYSDGVAIIEQQSVRAGQGLSSSGLTMEQFGFLKGLCLGLGFTVEVVEPKVWQKLYKSLIIPESIHTEVFKWAWDKTGHKGNLVCQAIHSFPYLSFVLKGSKKPHSGIADASLIVNHYASLQQRKST